MDVVDRSDMRGCCLPAPQIPICHTHVLCLTHSGFHPQLLARILYMRTTLHSPMKMTPSNVLKLTLSLGHSSIDAF